MYCIPGLTSPKTQRFINSLCSNAESYLEVGSAFGATAVAALDGNNLDAYFVDTFEGTIQDAKGKLDLPPLSKQTFIDNIKPFKGKNRINLFHSDMFDVDLTQIKPIDVFLYDADHNKEITADAIEYFSKVFSDVCVMIIDDANFEGVVEGAQEGIRRAGLHVGFERLLLNDLEDPSAWWNGLYILTVVRKQNGSVDR